MGSTIGFAVAGSIFLAERYGNAMFSDPPRGGLTIALAVNTPAWFAFYFCATRDELDDLSQIVDVSKVPQVPPERLLLLVPGDNVRPASGTLMNLLLYSIAAVVLQTVRLIGDAIVHRYPRDIRAKALNLWANDDPIRFGHL